MEFDDANEEPFYCRPLRREGVGGESRMPVPDEAGPVRVAFLPPMSGLATNEPRLDPGRVQVLIGEGRTAEVLRNLCYQVVNGPDADTKRAHMEAHIRSLFGVELQRPKYLPERGEITMTYREQVGQGKVEIDLSSAGRGLPQTLLLLSYLYANPGAVLLLDEPDAHLEILRQRLIYRLLTDVAREQGSQIIAATRSKVVADEAGGREMAIAFVGAPHRIDDRGSHALKALPEIGFPKNAIDSDVKDELHAICEVAERARPRDEKDP
jgi:hypothetical protein